MQIILYSDDINYLDYWDKSIQDCTIVNDLEKLYHASSSLIIINFTACTPTCQSVIQKLKAKENKVLVLHSVPDLDTAKKILKLGAMGYGNTLMRKHFLEAAINAIKENMVWIHPELTTKLILEIEESPQNSMKDKTLKKLSNRECEVALLLKDGYTYNEIALKLNITARTIKAHAQNIYAKLDIKDRLSLAVLLR